MAADNSIAYTITDCGFSYRGNPCLHSIDISLRQGRFYGLVGPNGSGKTTLVNLLTGTAKPTSGTMNLYHSAVHSYAKADLARLLSLVPQSFSMEFEYTVFEVVMMGRHPYIDRFGSPSKEDFNRVTSALETLDIQHLQDRFVTRLSGGERQRVLVARALAQNTRVMVLDEATASLDVRHSIDIMKALRHRVDTEDVTIVAAIHDLDLAAAFCDELIVMHHGTIHSHGEVETILTPELLHNIFAVEANILNSVNGPPHIQYRYSHA
jgi:iron complex transport system ATP-binding protein